MRNKLMVTGLLLAVAFFGGSLVIVYHLTGDAPEARGPGLAPAPWGTEPVPAAPAESGPATALATGQPVPIALPANVPDPVPVPPPAWLEGSTQSLGPTRDPTALGPLRPYVASGLGRLQRTVAECAAELPAGAGSRRGRVVLTLQIETLDARLRIVDSTLVDQDDAGDPRVECAQKKLRGQLIPAPCRKGSSFEVPFVLNL